MSKSHLASVIARAHTIIGLFFFIYLARSNLFLLGGDTFVVPPRSDVNWKSLYLMSCI
jgi:hypothetical protein